VKEVKPIKVVKSAESQVPTVDVPDPKATPAQETVEPIVKAPLPVKEPERGAIPSSPELPAVEAHQQKTLPIEVVNESPQPSIVS